MITKIRIVDGGGNLMSLIGIADPNQAAMLYWNISQKLKACGSKLTAETDKGISAA